MYFDCMYVHVLIPRNSIYKAYYFPSSNALFTNLKVLKKIINCSHSKWPTCNLGLINIIHTYITARLTYVLDRVELFSHQLSKFSQLDHTIQHQRLACCFYLVECKNFDQIPRWIYDKYLWQLCAAMMSWVRR